MTHITNETTCSIEINGFTKRLRLRIVKEICGNITIVVQYHDNSDRDPVNDIFKLNEFESKDFTSAIKALYFTL